MLQAASLEVGQEIADRLIRLRRQIDLLELEFARLSAEFQASDWFMEEGFTTPINWIRATCHMNGPAAADRVAVGECLELMPKSHQAMQGGELGFSHLVVMARTAQSVGERFDESELIAKARQQSPGRFHHTCDHYRHAKDPIRFAEDQAEAFEHRKLELKAWQNGVLSIKGYLDAVGGAALRSALEPLARPTGADDHREREQRLADALVELAAGRQRPHIQVTASIETLYGLLGATAAETEFSQPIASRTVERWACDSNVTRILLGGESTVIEVGRAKRTVEGPTRRALNARDGCCRWPGCDRPAKWTAAHHLVHWIDGGPTDLDNLILLCFRHHRMVHEGGWRLIKTEAGGIVTLRPPDRFEFARGPDWTGPGAEAPGP